VLLLGSGGAARGVIAPLLDQSLESIIVAGRSGIRAKSLARQFGTMGPVQGCDLENIPRGTFSLIINATSSGLTGQAPLIPATVLDATTFCYDMSYAKVGTAFLRWAKEQGCTQLAQGWGMLVEQAAESFELWRGVRPPTAHVLTALKSGSAL
jgi:shikimate dehydrogenase